MIISKHVVRDAAEHDCNPDRDVLKKLTDQMHWNRLCMAFWPGLIVISISAAMGGINIFYSLPRMTIQHPDSPLPGILKWATLFFYAMFVWCWIYTASCDPGRTRDDLEARGVLNDVLRGDIPRCLRSLPICQKCKMPRPPTSYHCDECNHCVLRYDHHCGVIGACIADKNSKSFVLTFVYAFGYGILNALTGVLSISLGKGDALGILALVASVYSAVLGVALLGFAISFVCDGMRTGAIDTMGERSRTVSLKKYFATFGDSWWKRVIPIQPRTTYMAWHGISWEDDVEYV